MPDVGPTPTKRTWLRWLVLLILIAFVVAFYAFGLQRHFAFQSIRGQLDNFKNSVDEHFLTGIVVFFALYTIITALSLPVAFILTLLGGALFGRLLGTTVVLFAATCGATLSFWSSRFLFGDWVQAKHGSRLEVLNRGIEKDGAFYLFSLRLVPLFPFFLINLGMGLTPIRTWTYFWVSLVGMLPGTFLYINAGTELAQLEKAEDLISPGLIVSLSLLGLAPLVFRKLLQWRTSRVEGDTPSKL